MGNCLVFPKNKIVPEDSLNLMDHNDEIKHNIDTNTESIHKIQQNLIQLNKTNNENFELVSKDIEQLKIGNEYLTQIVNNISQHYLSNHHSLSKYGGLAPDTEQESVEGPSETIDSTSSNLMALL
jgi:hypothetical protein